MVDIKQAIANAKSYAADVLGIERLLLEEVHSRGDHFERTLSFPRRIPHTNLLLDQAVEYKTFQVNKNTGEVEGMSIREIA
jgi:hypothetical protein